MINEATTVGIGLVVTLMMAAFSFGVMWQKIGSVKSEIKGLSVRIDKLESQLEKFLNQLFKHISNE